MRTAAVKTLQRLCPCCSSCWAWLQITYQAPVRQLTHRTGASSLAVIKSFFGNKVVFCTHSGIRKRQGEGLENVGALVDVVKPVDDIEEGEGEGEYYP